MGARLIQLVGRVEVIMDEIVDATGNRFAAIDVMVVWSGNELVGSQGVFCSPDPIAGRIVAWRVMGDIRSISSGILRALRVLAGIWHRPRSGFVSVVLGSSHPGY